MYRCFGRSVVRQCRYASRGRRVGRQLCCEGSAWSRPAPFCMEEADPGKAISFMHLFAGGVAHVCVYPK